VRSVFAVEARVLDTAYFREMMRESRRRRRQKREAVQRMLAETRSGPLAIQDEPSLADVPGLEAGLDEFVRVPLARTQEETRAAAPPAFEMECYRARIRELVGGCVVHFEGVGPLIADLRLDRIRRFITIVFMQQFGEVTLRQEGDGDILIMENETQRERQAVH